MKIYFFSPDPDNYASIEFVDEKIEDKFLQGKSIRNEWTPPSVYIYDSSGPLGDFPALSDNIPVFSKKAWESLSPFLFDSVEALPLIITNLEYYAINVLEMTDCIDHNKSEFRRYENGAIASVNHFCIKTQLLKNKNLFIFPETKYLDTYVSEAFINCVKTNSLKGSIFRELEFESI